MFVTDENFVQYIIIFNFFVVLSSLSRYVRLCIIVPNTFAMSVKFMLNECVTSVYILNNWNIVRFDSVAAGNCSGYDEIINK